MASAKRNADEQQKRLSSLFHAYDVDKSGRIEKNEFSAICRELQVPSREEERIFNRLDVNRDGTVTLEEFISGFREQQEGKRDSKRDKSSSALKEFSIGKDQSISR